MYSRPHSLKELVFICHGDEYIQPVNQSTNNERHMCIHTTRCTSDDQPGAVASRGGGGCGKRAVSSAIGFDTGELGGFSFLSEDEDDDGLGGDVDEERNDTVRAEL